MTEKIVTDPKTGGQKGMKPERYSLVPLWPLAEMARVYDNGTEKYSPWNWRKGYDWSLSYDALERHIRDGFWAGESINPESGFHHLAHAGFHLFTLMEFERLKLGTDDRVTTLFPDKIDDLGALRRWMKYHGG